MLLGLALIAVPLLVAVVDAALQIRSLPATSQKLVLEGVQSARAVARSLFAHIASLERTARLYQVLDDPELLDAYRAHDERLAATRSAAQRSCSTRTRRASSARRIRDHAQGTIASAVVLHAAGQRRPSRRSSRASSELNDLADTIAREEQRADRRAKSPRCSARPRARSGGCSGSPRCCCR